MNEMINAVRYDRVLDFRERYRSVDVLLVDDIQFLAGKEGTQTEFFHTFNALYDSQKQIVISSDCPPHEIPQLEERLRSRFEWGLIADIQQPDIETRIAILRSKLNGRENSVPAEVLEFIAHKAQSSIRELEGSLNRVLAYAQLHRAGLSIDLAAAALQAVSPAQTGRAVARPDDLIQAVVRYYGVSLADLRGKQRDKRIVVPRQVAMFLLREDARLSTPEIGRLLGGRDHTTVMHGAQKIAGELPRAPQLRGDIQAIRELLQAR
jgi:chromosomal replication initiator protein